jgi:hypothetical protein
MDPDLGIKDPDQHQKVNFYGRYLSVICVKTELYPSLMVVLKYEFAIQLSKYNERSDDNSEKP